MPGEAAACSGMVQNRSPPRLEPAKRFCPQPMLRTFSRSHAVHSHRSPILAHAESACCASECGMFRALQPNAGRAPRAWWS